MTRPARSVLGSAVHVRVRRVLLRGTGLWEDRRQERRQVRASELRVQVVEVARQGDVGRLGVVEAAAGEAIVEEPVLLAIRVSIGFAPSLESERVSPPLELIVPVVAQAPVNETEDEETGAEGGATGGEGGATGGGGGQ